MNPEAVRPDGGDGNGVGGNGSADLALPPAQNDGGVHGGALLSFAVFGDCRPPLPEQTTGYPTMIVTGIFSRAETEGAQFVIGTGDYMNALTANAVDAQVNLFLGARASFTGPVYLTMGNHECMTTTSGNCPNANETPNAKVYMSKLAPSGSTKPYFRIDMPTPLGSAKLVFIAANAWSTEQGDWLKTQLADPTHYTFVIRHEASNDQSAPGVGPSDALMMGAPLTVGFFGHTHVYQRVDPSHVIAGNGGAPLDSGTQYGFVLVKQRADGNLSLSAIDQATGNPIDAWAVTPDGQLTQ
ncbi:MAG: metallophosphoesterase [Myxococcales bacterium]|nr:metallophosphoesterase [Myxococcales bacterium]